MRELRDSWIGESMIDVGFAANMFAQFTAGCYRWCACKRSPRCVQAEV